MVDGFRRDGPDLDMLLTTLKERAARSTEDARALPPGLYVSEEVFALEQERIFAKEWACIGRADELAQPGDYLTWEVASQPVVVVRQQDGGLRAFSNVCLHRMTVLLEGAGHCDRIVCPYHAWTYDIEGQLVGASRMDRTPGFDLSELRLPELRCDVWAGWIYVNLDPDASPITERLRPLHDLVARYHMQDYVHVVRKDDVWDTNWKLLTENFMEGYHLPFTHRSTFGQWFSAEETQFADECSDGFSYQSFVKNDDAGYGVAPPGNTRLEGRWRNTSVLPTVYPSHMYVLAPDHLWYLSLQPREPGRVGVRFGVALAPERIEMLEDREAYVQELCEFFDRANAEDRSIVEGIFRGMQGALARPGPLSWLERQLHELTRYLARRLTGEG